MRSDESDKQKKARRALERRQNKKEDRESTSIEASRVKELAPSQSRIQS